MVWRINDPQGDECGKVRWETVPFTRGLGLDIGCGPMKLWPQAIGIDNRKDTGMFGIQMNPDITVPDACDIPLFASGTFAWVFSSHTLEHIPDYKKALKEWWRLVKDGGYLILYLPHKLFYPNIGQEGANPDHKHDFLPEDIISAMKDIGGWDLVVNEDRNQDNEYSFYLVFKKYSDRKMHRFSCKEPKPTGKTCAIIRYGAWGDVIQMSSILPALKKEGYHITLYTTDRAYAAIEHEPLIDRFIIQEHEQVPNAWLGPFWDYIKKKYDRFINLSESIEASLLAMPDRTEARWWPTEARHAHMNQNYVEFTHKIAQVPYEGTKMRFVETPEERKWAEGEAKKFKGAPLILWVISGSSVHKVWPYMDITLSQILGTFPEARIVTVGDDRCKQIEEGFPKSDRIIKRSSQWTIRETMAFAKQCNLVMGPETGVMSAVSMESMPKIVLLSHSSVENLTRDWVNTLSLHSHETPCYPCHKQIYTWDHCNRFEKTGVAHCMSHIHPEMVWKAVLEALEVKLVANEGSAGNA